MEYRNKYLKYKQKYLLSKYASTVMQSHDNGEGNEKVKTRLALYEILNFEGANEKNWSILSLIYDPNVLIRMANDAGMKGLKQNIKMMQEMYTMAPDTRIVRHDIQFGSGDYTATEQIMVGTFTGPMKSSTGKIYNPTGKKFEMRSCSLVRWKNNKIIEENIFWDNEYYTQQLGVESCASLINHNRSDLLKKISFSCFGRGCESDNKLNELLQHINFNGYNKRNWHIIRKHYDDDVVLMFSNGKTINGIDNILNQMQNGMTDDQVVSMPILFSSGNYTAVSMIMGGTIPNSNGKTWAIEHLSLIRWENDKIIESYMFLDNTESRKQSGQL